MIKGKTSDDFQCLDIDKACLAHTLMPNNKTLDTFLVYTIT
jgi:hypothetical protein